MCRFTITAVITKTTGMLDSGEWQMCMSWKKRVTLEAEQREQAVALRDLLNGGTIEWVNATSNSGMWQWEFPADHSAMLLDVMRHAGIDWPDPIPDIDHPSITINLAVA